MDSEWWRKEYSGSTQILRFAFGHQLHSFEKKSTEYLIQLNLVEDEDLGEGQQVIESEWKVTQDSF